MITECRKILIETLKAAGIRNKPYTSQKFLSLAQESHVGAVLFEKESLQKEPLNRVYIGEDGKKRKRKRLFSRMASFNIVIGEYTVEAAEAIYENFLEQLPAGFYVDGNYVNIEPNEAEWMDEKDHILKSKVAVQLLVLCNGGVYKDTDYLQTDKVDIQVRKE